MLRRIFGCACAAFGLAAVFAAPAEAVYFVTTGQTGAQVQLDVNHTQHWTYTVPAGGIVDGALFTMKRGPSTNESITLDLIQGTFADFGTATPLLSVTLGPSDLDQDYDPVAFVGTPVALLTGVTYTAILYSDAPDVQSQAYFIKQPSEATFGLTDEDEEVLPPIDEEDPQQPPVPSTAAANPEPASALLGLVGLVALGARRRQVA